MIQRHALDLRLGVEVLGEVLGLLGGAENADEDGVAGLVGLLIEKRIIAVVPQTLHAGLAVIQLLRVRHGHTVPLAVSAVLREEFHACAGSRRSGGRWSGGKGFTVGLPANAAITGLLVGGGHPSVTQWAAPGLAAKGAGFRFRAGGGFPAVAEGTALGLTADSASGGVGAACRHPAMTQRTALGCAAESADGGAGTGGR